VNPVGRAAKCGATAALTTGLLAGATCAVTVRGELICANGTAVCPAALWIIPAIAAIAQEVENSYRFIKRSGYSTSQTLLCCKLRLERIQTYSGIGQSLFAADRWEPIRIVL
jgi:hypothetical protein